MWTDFGKTLLHSLYSAADHPTKNTSAGSHLHNNYHKLKQIRYQDGRKTSQSH